MNYPKHLKVSVLGSPDKYTRAFNEKPTFIQNNKLLPRLAESIKKESEASYTPITLSSSIVKITEVKVEGKAVPYPFYWFRPGEKTLYIDAEKFDTGDRLDVTYHTKVVAPAQKKEDSDAD